MPQRTPGGEERLRGAEKNFTFFSHPSMRSPHIPTDLLWSYESVAIGCGPNIFSRQMFCGEGGGSKIPPVYIFCPLGSSSEGLGPMVPATLLGLAVPGGGTGPPNRAASSREAPDRLTPRLPGTRKSSSLLRDGCAGDGVEGHGYGLMQYRECCAICRGSA